MSTSGDTATSSPPSRSVWASVPEPSPCRPRRAAHRQRQGGRHQRRHQHSRRQVRGYRLRRCGPGCQRPLSDARPRLHLQRPRRGARSPHRRASRWGHGARGAVDCRGPCTFARRRRRGCQGGRRQERQARCRRRRRHQALGWRHSHGRDLSAHRGNRRRCATWTRRTASCGARSGVLSAGMTEVS